LQYLVSDRTGRATRTSAGTSPPASATWVRSPTTHASWSYPGCRSRG